MNPALCGVYLVSCVSRKRNEACAACDLYTSDWFVKARSYAEASGYPWFILSAEYGLVKPDQIVAPYERTLNKMPIADRREWAKRVDQQLIETIPEMTHAIFLAGIKYREFLAQHLTCRGVAVSVPMKGLTIGKQLSWLQQHIAPLTTKPTSKWSG